MLYILVAFIVVNASIKNTGRKMQHDLRKNILSNVHKFGFAESRNQIVTAVLSV